MLICINMNRKDKSDGNELVLKTTFEYKSIDEKRCGIVKRDLLEMCIAHCTTVSKNSCETKYVYL